MGPSRTTMSWQPTTHTLESETTDSRTFVRSNENVHERDPLPLCLSLSDISVTAADGRWETNNEEDEQHQPEVGMLLVMVDGNKKRSTEHKTNNFWSRAQFEPLFV